MFLLSRWLTLGVLGLTIYALWTHLFTSNTARQAAVTVQEVQAKTQETEKSVNQSVVTQYRQGLRRDFYEGRGTERRHVFYKAQQTETRFQEKQREIEELLTECEGVFYEEGGEMWVKSPKAKCLSRPMTLVMEQVECRRLQNAQASDEQQAQEPHMLVNAEKAVWRLPVEDHQPWVLETEGMKMRTRP